MIKNNFKILEEEREQILNLVRLPNYRKPIRLSEQKWPALHTPTGTPTDTEKNKETLSQKLNSYSEKGHMGNIEFDNYNMIKRFFDVTYHYVANGWRSTSFWYFLKALPVAQKLYGEQDYGKWYNELIEASKKIQNQVKNLSSYELSDFDSFSSPSKYQVELYEEPIFITDEYDGVPAFKLKNFRITKGDISGDSTNEPTQGQAKTTVLSFLDKTKQGMDAVVTQEICVALLTNYIGEIIPGKTQIIEDELSTIKKTIAYCNLPKTSTTTNKRGKTRIRVEGNGFGKLSRRLRKELEGLAQRTDRFKINLTTPENN